MNWTQLWFGRCKGKTLPQVLFSDPDWFYWAIEDNVFVDKGIIEDEARDINHKSRNIRIPDNEEEDLVAEYYIRKPSNKFQHMEIVPKTRETHIGAIRRNVIGLSIPRRISAFDKRGGKNLVSNMKFYLFDDSHYRITKNRCEEFFNDESNFVNT